jgi:putative hydrolase
VVRRASLDNAEIAELLWRAGAGESAHRKRAFARASGAARFWPKEAADVAAAGRSLTELRGVGPWIAAHIHGWLDAPPLVPEPDETRRGYLTYAHVRRVLDAEPNWEQTPHADLQVHSTDSDGVLSVEEMAAAARSLGRTFIASTDHSSSLKIARGMTPDELQDQGRRIDALNAAHAEGGDAFRVLRSIEMDVFVDGSCDMSAADLVPLDLVLGAFHTKLRDTDDRTDRYLAALGNPLVHVLAHPKARMYGRRVGLTADWPHVFEEAARLGKAIELDATPSRQDLNVDLARVAMSSGVRWFSMGSDAHSAAELGFLPFAMAIAVLAGIPRDHVLNYRTADEVTAWARELRERHGA